MPDYKSPNMGVPAPWYDHRGSFATVIIENGVTRIGTHAFFLQSLSSISIPNTVTSIGDWVFIACGNLKSIVLPNSVTKIGTGAFFDCGISSIVLPSNVTEIGNGAFRQTLLTSVTNLNPVPVAINPIVFEGVNISACTLEVPIGSVEAYKRAEVWKEFNIVGVAVDIEEKTAPSNLLLVYPNPATGSCSITMPDEFLYESQLTLTVYDASGRLVRQMVLDNNAETPQLRLGLEATGVYVVVLSNGRKEYRGKVVFN